MPKKDALVHAVQEQGIAQIQSQAITLSAIQETVSRLKTVRSFIVKNLNSSHTRYLKKLGGKKPTEQQAKELKTLEIDFGTVPGVNKKFLLQPGAERICQWLQVRPVYETSVEAIPDHPGHIDVVSRCRLIAVGTNEEVFSGPMASCSTMESNFRYVWVKMDPQPKNDWAFGEGKMAKAIGTHKCFPEKSGGTITGWVWQERRENPNIYDKRNNVRQMSEKRALVKATRNFGALSEIFTEDPSEWVLESETDVQEQEQPPTGRIVKEPEPASEPTPAAAAASATVEVHWVPDNKDVALITVLPASFVEQIKGFCFFNDVRKCWTCPASMVAEVAELAKAHGYQFVEIDDGKKATPAPAPEAPKGPKLPPVGKVTNVRKETGRTKGSSYMMVLFAGVWIYCYKTDLFPYLNSAVGKECRFVLSATALPKIEQILSIGSQEFESNVPVIQMGDDRGSPLR